ncbi:MAG: hypothetical protein AB8B56_12890 [Crocinitomicaceae bacterium]
MRLILGIENPQIIRRISDLIKGETSDFWDELTLDQQDEVNQAIKELNAGKGMNWDEFRASVE